MNIRTITVRAFTCSLISFSKEARMNRIFKGLVYACFCGLIFLTANLVWSQTGSHLPPDAANSWQGILREGKTLVPVPTHAQAIERGAFSDALTGTATLVDDYVGEPQRIGSGSGEPGDELPTAISDAVVVADFTDHEGVISPSRKSAYTAIAFYVERSLKDKTGLSKPGSTITVFYPGGTVRTNSGRVVSFEVVPIDLAVRLGHKYLLFLQYNRSGNFYTILKSWEITKGIMVPNSHLDKNREINHESEYAGKPQRDVLSAARSRIVAEGKEAK
jgi:hypothetical protein